MITGFNQDVQYKNKVYHVQTEDRGEKNPLVETLIYVGGEIIASRRTSYEDIIKESYDEAKVAALLDKQHKRVVVDIRLGKFEPKEKSPFPESLITTRSLDEVILDYLTSETEGEALAVAVLDQGPFVFGERGFYRIQAATDITKTPLPGAAVTVKVAYSAGEVLELFNGTTDRNGLCEAVFTLPSRVGSAAIILNVNHRQGAFETKALVARGRGR